MTDLTYRVRPVEASSADRDLVDRACRIASLAHYGTWYRLELNPAAVTCCTPGPLGPARAFLWVNPARGDRPLRIKRAARLVDPEPWQEPAVSLRVQLAAGMRLCGQESLLVERALAPDRSTGGTYYRVTSPAGHAAPVGQLLVEARPQ